MHFQVGSIVRPRNNTWNMKKKPQTEAEYLAVWTQEFIHNTYSMYTLLIWISFVFLYGGGDLRLEPAPEETPCGGLQWDPVIRMIRWKSSLHECMPTTTARLYESTQDAFTWLHEWSYSYKAVTRVNFANKLGDFVKFLILRQKKSVFTTVAKFANSESFIKKLEFGKSWCFTDKSCNINIKIQDYAKLVIIGRNDILIDQNHIWRLFHQSRITD